MGLMVFLGGALVVYLVDPKPKPDTQSAQTTHRATPTEPHTGSEKPVKVEPKPKPVDDPRQPGEDPKDLVVDRDAPESRGYRTIGVAVKKARGGATIKIKKGIYRETITLDKKIHLLGEPGVEVYGHNGPALVVQGDGGSVTGLTLRCNTRIDNPKEKDPTVSILEGALELTDCEVGWEGAPAPGRTNAGACVLVKGAGTQLTLTRCRLHSGQQGLWVLAGARPTVKHCRIENNQVGVWVEKAGGLFEDCTVRQSQDVNVLVTGAGADVTLKACSILEGAEGGVQVTMGAKVVLTACKIHRNDGLALKVVGDDSYLDASGCRKEDLSGNREVNGKPWAFEDPKTFREPNS
jgi:hypothetical protein